MLVAVYTVNRIVSFSLDILQRAVENGAKGVREPWEEKDEHGSVVMATVQTVSTQHTSPILPIEYPPLSHSMVIPHILSLRGPTTVTNISFLAM